MTFTRRVFSALIVVSSSLLGLALLQSTGAAAASRSASHTGALTAIGDGMFNYEADTAGTSYNQVSISGTLTGFVPDTTYYLYDNAPYSSNAVPVTSNAIGYLIFHRATLDQAGATIAGTYLYRGTSTRPVDRRDLQYHISTDPNSAALDPPDGLVYAPPTELLPNKSSNPWRAAGGTRFENVGTASLYNRSANGELGYSFGPTSYSNGNYCLFNSLKRHTQHTWCTRTTSTSRTADYIAFQRDGNLVVYRSGKAIWSSGTQGHPDARLVLQRDGNLVIRSAKGATLWQAHPGPRR